MAWASFHPHLRILLRLRIDISPEGGNILRQIAKHQVGAVAAKISFAGLVFGQRKDALGIVPLLDQRPICIARVLVGIAEQKFPERGDIGVVDRVAQARWLVALPIDDRLAYAVLEAERLIRPMSSVVSDTSSANAVAQGSCLISVSRLANSVRRGVEQHDHMRHSCPPAPLPAGPGSFGPTSPNRRERLSSPAIPTMNSSEKPCRISSETPSAFNPSYVKAI